MENKINYIFFGTPELAKIILEELIGAGFIPAAVVCNPDKPAGRKKIITPPPVKVLAQKFNISVFQPEKLDKDFALQLSNLTPQVFIVAAYGKIIPKKIIEIAAFGAVGAHPSLLPKYRGASPIQSAILNGEKETGTTLYLMDEKVDNGPILANKELEIKNKNYETLLRELAGLSGNLLIETLPEFLAGKIKPQGQDHSKATFTKKFTVQDSFVENSDLEKAIRDGGSIAVKIYDKIRALNPEPGAWTIKDDKRMKILEAEIIPDNRLKLRKIQFEGKVPHRVEHA